MKKKILSHTSVMIVLTVILTFIAASFVMYDKFNSTMKKGVRDEAEYVKVGIEEVGEEYLNGNVGKTTDTLTNREIDAMFGIVRKLKAQGVAIIYISHRMEEIFALADRITVMRDGKYVGTKMASEIDNNGLIKMMVGRDLDEQYPTVEKEIWRM